MYRYIDDKFQFKLVYDYADGTQDILEWRQSNWLTDSTISGADLFNIPTQTVDVWGQFFGLGYGGTYSLCDGNGAAHNNWWQSVGVFQNDWQPAFNGKISRKNKIIYFQCFGYVRIQYNFFAQKYFIHKIDNNN